MRLSTKHANQQVVDFKDFAGGLNTTATPDSIQANQLSQAVNVEIDTTTGLLQTIQGTERVLTIDNEVYPHKVVSAAFDTLNNTLLMFLDCGIVLASCDKVTYKAIGRLTGTQVPITCVWEDGLLIASGGKLQYVSGMEMKTIETSPAQCNGVFSRDGRVFIFDSEDTIHFSGTGDEENWTEESNDDSSAVFVQVGYKAGGKIIGVANLSDDVLIFKDTGTVFRLAGSYPDWEIKQVSKNLKVKGRMAFCTMMNNVIALSETGMHQIAPTDDYGEVRAGNIGSNVQREITDLTSNCIVRFLSGLNQVWCIGSASILVYDVTANAYFERVYNGKVVDVVNTDNNVYLIKEDGICTFNPLSFFDDNEPLKFAAVPQINISHYEYLIKRVVIAATPIGPLYTFDNNVRIGSMKFLLPENQQLQFIHQNFNKIFRSTLDAKNRAISAIYSAGKELVYDDFENIYHNSTFLYPTVMLVTDDRIRYRDKSIRIRFSGIGRRFIFNNLKLDIVEV